MHGHRKIVLLRIELDFAAGDNVSQYRQATLTGNRQVADADPIADRHRRLGGMSAFTHDNLTYAEPFCRLNLADQNLGELHVVVPYPVVDPFIAHHFRRQCPADPGSVEQDSEGGRVFRPGEEFAGIVQ